MSLSRKLTQGSKYMRDIEAVESGDPARVERRIKNRVIGRLLAKAGFWRWLWQ